MTTPADGDDGSATVVTSRRVKPGHERDFEHWLDGVGAAAARYPGFVWRRITRPNDHDRPEWVVVFKFDSYAHLRAPGWSCRASRGFSGVGYIQCESSGRRTPL
jgi:antibiotic biosynthesis monooxygenase (ABM) superfamily enzyme